MKLSGQTAMTIQGIKQQQQRLREQMELVLLRDLVDQLDPDHDYSFDAHKMEFTKTVKVKPEKEGLQ